MYEVMLIVLGVFLGLVPPWYLRRRRLKTHWAALRADLNLCQESVGNLMKDQVMAPLYRLPLKSYDTSFPVLLADGAIAEDEVLTLSRCFGLIEDINRGLDNAAAANMAGQDSKLEAEYKRNLMKATQLIEGKSENEAILEQARKTINEKLSQEWWKFS